MKRVLLTGMSGVGKSSVVAELVARGHKAVDTDEADLRGGGAEQRGVALCAVAHTGAKIKDGQDVVIYGATGAIGSAAV